MSRFGLQWARKYLLIVRLDTVLGEKKIMLKEKGKARYAQRPCFILGTRVGLIPIYDDLFRTVAVGGVL
jgi:hypothetical protein